MNRACFLKNTTELSSSTKLNLHENIDKRAASDLLKSIYLRMKKQPLLIMIIGVLTLSTVLSGCRIKSEEESFSFVFMTDIHVQPEKNATEGLKKAIIAINEMNPDFVITGGDLIMDALGQSYGRADSLYKLYQKTISNLKMPVYNTMGNHELYGIYPESGADRLHPEYGEKMFEKRLGKSYYSFDYNGWKFMILNSVEESMEHKYVGKIDESQMEWIKRELNKTDSLSPIVIVTHIPFLSVEAQKYIGATVPEAASSVVCNSKEVLDLFIQHNLKLVLQGHTHLVQDIFIDDIHFISGGAISGSVWRGPSHGDEEGFMFITVRDNEFQWEYIDYEWKISK
jgi:3',5'-cyclic-AMP phosphodiesterase